MEESLKKPVRGKTLERSRKYKGREVKGLGML